MMNVHGLSSRITASWTNNLFTRLDSKNQGFIEKSDLQSAFSKVAAPKAAGLTISVDEVFSRLDGDSDGKVTQDELNGALQTLAGELDSQFNRMRLQRGEGGHGGVPLPPIAVNGAGHGGFTKDELSSQLSKIGNNDSKRSSLIASIVENFDTADTDANGKVSMREAMAFGKASRDSATADESGTGASASHARRSEASVMMRIVQLMQAYQSVGQETTEQPSTLSTSA